MAEDVRRKATTRVRRPARPRPSKKDVTANNSRRLRDDLKDRLKEIEVKPGRGRPLPVEEWPKYIRVEGPPSRPLPSIEGQEPYTGGNVNVSKSLTVRGSANLAGRAVAHQGLVVKGDLGVTGSTSLGADVGVAGNVNLGKGLIVKGAIHAQSDDTNFFERRVRALEGDVGRERR